jgi:hypothetical protein
MQRQKHGKWQKARDKHEFVEPREITDIETRVGTTPLRRLQWALEFAKRDLSSLTVGDWANLRREVVAFDGWVIPHDQVKSKRLLKGLLDVTRQVPTWPPGRVPLPTEEEVRQIQEEIRIRVETLLKDGEVSIGINASFVILRDPRGQGVYFSRVPRAPSWGGLTLANLLGAFAHLVRECRDEKCRTWFVASRANKWYCSTRCLSRATTRESRRSKADPRIPATQAPKPQR